MEETASSSAATAAVLTTSVAVVADDPKPLAPAQKYGLKIAFSSQLTANIRAQESKRPDALIHDPFAALIAGDVPANHANFVLRKYDSKDEGKYHRISSIHTFVYMLEICSIKFYITLPVSSTIV